MIMTGSNMIKELKKNNSTAWDGQFIVNDVIVIKNTKKGKNMSFKDTTFCASPNCENKCGRKISDIDMSFLKGHSWLPVAYAYFCGEPCKHEWVSSSFLVMNCNKCGELKND